MERTIETEKVLWDQYFSARAVKEAEIQQMKPEEVLHGQFAKLNFTEGGDPGLAILGPITLTPDEARAFADFIYEWFPAE